MFLEETCGEGVFYKIADEAMNRGFDSAYENDALQAAKDFDTKELVEIISTSTSDDVFDRFADWNRKVWPDRVEDYTAYMESIGLSIG